MVMKINATFPIKQNILLLYVIMSFDNFICLNYMHESNTSFVWKMDLKMFIVGIESYGDIILYFYEFGNMKRIFDFGFYGPHQWV